MSEDLGSDPLAEAYDRGYKDAFDKFDNDSRFAQSTLDNANNIHKYIGKTIDVMRAMFNKSFAKGEMLTTYESMFSTLYLYGSLNEFPSDPEDFAMKVYQLVKMGHDFKILLDEFNQNELVKSQWDRLIMTMKLTHNGDNNVK